jgi:membrane protein DedA with SNARE-associated domain
VTQLLIDHGLAILFVLVAIESAGVPVPGETALVAAAVLAAGGHYQLWEVIVVAALAAIVGDNVGYWLGRKGGRALFGKTPWVRDYFERALPPAERFFERHGPKAVFIGRFVAVLRVTSAWLAGISHMPWGKFLFWNAAGGTVWATIVGLVAYFAGAAAAEAINRYGLYAAIAIVIGLVAAFIGFRIWRRRVVEEW